MLKLNSKLNPIGTIVIGTKLNVGTSVVAGAEMDLCKIILPAGTWIIICSGWNPIGGNSIIGWGGYEGCNTGDNKFAFSFFCKTGKQKTITISGVNYSGNAVTITGNYTAQAIRIA